MSSPPLAAASAAFAGKKRNKANVVTFSNKHNRKWQEPNLQYKKIFWEQGQRWVKLRVCTKVSTRARVWGGVCVCVSAQSCWTLSSC
jgi:ribosomal protein L28